MAALPGKVSTFGLKITRNNYAYADCRPKREEILKHCRFLVRKLRYEEMTRIDPLKAMQYLREHISDVIDHSDAEQLNNVSAELL